MTNLQATLIRLPVISWFTGRLGLQLTMSRACEWSLDRRPLPYYNLPNKLADQASSVYLATRRNIAELPILGLALSASTSRFVEVLLHEVLRGLLANSYQDRTVHVALHHIPSI